jgi:hypothetical protein
VQKDKQHNGQMKKDKQRYTKHRRAFNNEQNGP